MPRILVAYATKYGSTNEVAEVIGETIRQQGVEADVRPARDVDSLEGYDSVVLGTPVYIGQMLKPAKRFLDRFRAQLERMPVTVFMLGPISKEDDMDEARKQLDTALAKWDWFRPLSKEMFVGAYQPGGLRGLDKLLPRMKATPLYGKPARDDRDWDAIRAWAAALPEACCGIRS